MRLRRIGLALCSLATLWANGQTADSPNPNVKEIIVICKTHFDIGYTHRVKDLVNYYRTEMIDKAFQAMKTSADLPREQQFAWTIPGWVLSKTMDDWDGQSPERKQTLESKFRSGQIIAHALPFTLESDACGLEEMVRGLGFSTELCHKYGLPLSRSGKMTDVPSQAGALATVLANAGVKFFHIGCNWPSGYVKTPGLFWWEGPDGSRVLTLYSPIYGTSYGLYPPEWTSPSDPIISRNLIPAKDWPYKVWPAIMVTGDNSGAPTGEQIKAMFEELKGVMPDVNVHMGTMDDFYEALMKENPQLPVVKADMPDTWIHGIMCDPGGIRTSREVRPQLSAAEALNTQLRAWGTTQKDFADQVKQAYEQVALYGEHTWGGSKSVYEYGEAFLRQPDEAYQDLEGSWEDKTDYIRKAARITDEMTTANLAGLAAHVKSGKRGWVVYNPLPWKRSGVVEVDGQSRYVKDIPAGGYRVVADEPATPVATRQGNIIENRYYQVELDPARGCISSLVDKRTGREWVDKSADRSPGRYMNERFTYEQTLDYTMTYQRGRANEWAHPGMHKPGMISEKEVPYRAALAAEGRLSVSSDGYCQTAELSMPADQDRHMPASTLRVTLYDNQPYIDLEVTVRDKAKDNWPEADWLCLSFDVKQPEFNVYRQLGVMNPATDIQPGANRHLYAADKGVTMTEADGSGIAVYPLDHPLVSLGEPGCWKYSEDYVPRKPAVYLNLYNNQWNTNFRYWYPFTWSSRVRLWTLAGGTTPAQRNEQFVTQVLETRTPLQAARVGKQHGTLPAARSGLSLSRRGTVVTAFGTNPDGEGTLLRIWEQTGTPGRVTVSLPQDMQVSVAQPVNLRGELQGESLAVKGGKFSVELGAYAPASFILK